MRLVGSSWKETRSRDLNTVGRENDEGQLLAPAVTFNDRSTSTPYTESLQPPQIHSHYKCIILSLTKIPFIALLNLYQSTHSNLSPFSTSRCPSMMASIIEIVLYNKPTAERQYLLRASCHPLHTKRAFPALLQPCPENTTYMFLQREQEDTTNVFILSHSLTQATHPHVSL